MEIILSIDDVKRAAEYVLLAAERYPRENFDREEVRSLEEVQNQVFMGRIGELAFLRYFEKQGITIQAGRAVLPVGSWDVDDVCYRGWSIDVKCTGPYAENLLLQRSKIDNRVRAGELPHFFVAVKFVDDVPLPEHCLTSQNNLKLELEGFIDSRELLSETGEKYAVSRGESLQGSGFRVKAADYAIPFRDLSASWDDLIEFLKEKQPFAIEGAMTDGAKLDDEADSSQPASYSICLLGREAEKYASDDGIKQLTGWLQQGIKILLFLPAASRVKTVFQPVLDRFKAEKDLLNLCSLYVTDDSIPSAQIIDGQVSDDIREAWQKAAPSFNMEQFEIEHFSTNQPLIVKAGAGTGKTAVEEK